MTVHVEPFTLPGGSTDVYAAHAREIAIERTRLPLSRLAHAVILLMLLGGVTSACLVGKVSSWLLGGWLVWLVLFRRPSACCRSPLPAGRLKPSVGQAATAADLFL